MSFRTSVIDGTDEVRWSVGCSEFWGVGVFRLLDCKESASDIFLADLPVSPAEKGRGGGGGGGGSKLSSIGGGGGGREVYIMGGIGGGGGGIGVSGILP